MFIFTVQRYDVWKYYPNFFRNSENIPKFAAEKENLSDSGALSASKQNNILKFNFQYSARLCRFYKGVSRLKEFSI